MNFISTVLTFRPRRVAQRAGLLQKLSFRDSLEDLGTAWRREDGPLTAKSDDNHWMADNKGTFALMEALGLSIPGVKSKKTNQVTEEGLVIPRKTGRPRIRLVFVGPKRPRRRPRKSP